MPECVPVLRRPEDGVGYTVTGVRRACELLSVSAGDQILVFWKINMYS